MCVCVGVSVCASDQKLDLPLRLPAHQHQNQHQQHLRFAGQDGACDQGYGSERSPEDEVPPVLPHMQHQLPYAAVAAVLMRQPPAMVTFASDVIGVAAPSPSAADGLAAAVGQPGFSFVTPGMHQVAANHEDLAHLCVLE